MSFSTVLVALAEYAGDVLVNDCGRPVPARVLAYHGRMPDDCCPANGTLGVYWTDGRVSPGRDLPCGGPPEFTIGIRYTTCWSEPEVDEGGVVIDQAQDEQWNSDALMLADVADCMTRALTRLLCDTTPPPLDDPFATAVLAELVNRSARFQDVTPILPSGGCAGVLWRLIVSVRNPVVAS